MASIEERIGKDGEITFRAKIRTKGYPSQSATFKRKTDAKKWAIQTEAAISEGRHLKTNESKRRTLSELVDRYIEEKLPNKSSSKIFLKNQQFQLNWWKTNLGDYSLADITASKISKLRDQLIKEKGQPSTANRYLAALSHCFTVAVREWEWVHNNPVKNVTRNKETRGRVRFLSDDERKNLLEVTKATDSKLHLLVVMALATGARRGELLNSKWQDVDLDKETLILYETKNKEIRRLPLKGYTMKCLKEYYQSRIENIDYIFPSAQGKNKPMNIEAVWRNALKEAKIDGFRFHDLRHSAASYLAMNGASLAEIADVLGHKTLSMVKRYAHLTDAHTASVVEKMNNKIFED